MWMLSFTDMCVDKTRAAHTNNSTNSFTSSLKDIQICIHAAADPERATVFSTTLSRYTGIQERGDEDRNKQGI